MNDFGLTNEQLACLHDEWFHEQQDEKVRRYKKLNKLARKGQILFCGSSLMEQFPVHELLMDLDLPLGIYNRGVGGYTTVELAGMLDTLVFDLEPAHIFINIGTNDLNEEDYKLEGLLERYDMILTRIQQRLPQARIYVLAYYPCNHAIIMRNAEMAMLFHARNNERIREANRAVKVLAEQHQATFLEVGGGITDEAGDLKEEYTIDGVHIYGDGYMKVLEELLPVLKDLT